ncbi:MAG: elongation factor Ts [Gammaproteobacteria bacterium]|nr:elongation factor Ts [Gammaproteobacteria bacterium]
MTISATMVKELRERTGAGMMECKKALEETGGNIEGAIESMRKSGVAKAAKKSGRIAAEGIILIRQSDDSNESIILEVNCETDFVAKDENFRSFAAAVADSVLATKPANLEVLSKLPLTGVAGRTVEAARLQLVAKIGENIGLRRFQVLTTSGDFPGSYTHGTRIGVLVDLQGGDMDLARDIAMHIAASRPVCIAVADVPRDLLEQEKRIFTSQAQDSGKPPEIIEKMVTGRIQKYLNDITLLGQPFIKDPDQSVGKLLAARKAAVLSFIRYEVGEGIEKKVDNFAAEVMAQAGIK